MICPIPLLLLLLLLLFLLPVLILQIAWARQTVPIQRDLASRGGCPFRIME
jgi:hypothetical protein